ncbi:hypothetical protein [Actinomadura sp. 3N508]|uniref:hypothetical protein n=1 Tax=Actinomadura sp. 3N508 TaxID=3375153 RepID=UPI0037AAD6E7
MTSEERFDLLAGELEGRPGISPPGSGRRGGFGSATLRCDNKIFAMLAGGRLVVKLPKSRVDDLVAAGEGVRFEGNKGTPMREWFSLDPGSELPWPALAEEAIDHVTSST